jgi:hypothetical protein
MVIQANSVAPIVKGPINRWTRGVKGCLSSWVLLLRTSALLCWAYSCRSSWLRRALDIRGDAQIVAREARKHVCHQL